MALDISTLNDAQRAAATHTSGPLLVVAGAGTGKTRTLTHRIAYLIEQGAEPYKILALTFTNKAAKEMKERVMHLLGHDNYDNVPLVTTFHGFGVWLLRRFGEELGLPKGFTILDRSDALSVLKRAMKKQNYDPKEWDPKSLLNIMGRLKSDLKTIDDFAQESSSPMADVLQVVAPEYQKLKRKEGVVDFDDLLGLTYQLLQKPDIQQWAHNRFSHVHVDEYQDTNTIQYKLVRALLGDSKNICVVGDSDQTIYTWRGATIRNILQFETDFPGAKTVLLEENYRSTDTILQAAECVINENVQRIKKSLRGVKGKGEVITVYHAPDDKAEAKWVVKKINELSKQGYTYKDMAILYRTNFQSRVLEEQCLYTQTPYHVAGTKFFDRKEVKDVLAYLRFAFRPENLTDLARVVNEPKRGIGKKSVAYILDNQAGNLGGKAAAGYQSFLSIVKRIKAFAGSHAPSSAIEYVVNESGLRDLFLSSGSEGLERLANTAELANYASRYDAAFAQADHPDEVYEQLFADIALLSDQDSLGDATGGVVRLMTVHASKGLEFKVVFIVGLEQGLFPSDMGAGDDKRDEEEERRLMYVAVTRAQQKLLLSHAHTRFVFGSKKMQAMSEFIEDIPVELTDEEGDANPFGSSWNSYKTYGGGDSGQNFDYDSGGGLLPDIF